MAPETLDRLRRHLLASGLGAALWPGPVLAQGSATPVLAPRRLQAPRDLGSHPDFAIEWWYLTGHARSGGRDFGFQVTFFRSRVSATQALRSRFAAKQLIFAHAAVTDVQGKKLWHDQRIARASGAAEIDLAAASEADTDLRLRNWSLKREADQATTGMNTGAGQRSSYRARVAGRDFSLDLQCTETQSWLLQGDGGLSRKGPEATQASYYYSLPQLAVQGQITLQGQPFELDANAPNAAWLDHEWSQSLLPSQAVGWDWIGMNLMDGSALTAFRLRDAADNAVWAGGSFRAAAAGAPTRVFASAEVVFEPLRYWRSPLTQALYPVQWQVRTPIALYRVQSVIDDQELDSRQSTGAVYWEGLCELQDSQGQRVGRGYLEMTGYAGALRL
ncbi:MAG: carotenoid 1,2-hydratase [Gammaproteobacteria bacterium]|uniref:lipocalin-like domain-containing protein n=1 Tax=Rhodoferax sp. TaxID=50421 RepID=UPI001826EFC4|nr:carotenoid 1,2-hydratase [Rhodoferax sp.]MBU3897944.1 carotenoid 1,2-hydratase [Gammaproteobacteria bacterium]MBA3056870.1 carotenoid 1,2-hydratase [Rhodoferax sp.]MBU3996303.1 carotenoid 1,2-hydratase [Gammaproteobacteria bacterium]MBU4018605.1 carotenoid 1,2-hydratase [Gammaproteobacteria bacterium]MBU4080840.1 carotenoid 1,2-hydratase [Gammaproteobacteria bacterium]